MTYLSSLRGDIIIEQYEICKWKWLNALATKNGKRSHTDPATEEEEIQKLNEEDNELVDAVIRRYNNPYLLRYIKLYWEDYDNGGFIYFVNPLDIADYLSEKDITVQTAFGMTYIENFLGLYDVLAYSGVPQGKVYTTAKDNIILYYVNPANAEVAKAFDFTIDATGLIGIHRDVDYTTLTTDSTVISGSALYAELISGVVKVDIKTAAAAASETGSQTNPQG